MADPTYTPPRVWTWDKPSGGAFADINRPTAGARFERELPVGKHPLQLYSLATPNGQKVTIMLEELLAAGETGAGYDALYDTTTSTRVFESGSILMYLAEKFGAFLAPEGPVRTETLNWLFWQMGSAPFLGGGFGHFYHYAPEPYEYPINRYAMEVKRQLDVLDQNLAERKYLAGDDYSIADIATYPWYGGLVLHNAYEAAEFLDVASYTNVVRWAKSIEARPAVARGDRVNKTWGPEELQVPERHKAGDIS